LQAERFDEVAPEAHELGCQLIFIGDGGLSLRKSYADGLLDPDDVGEEMPTPGIGLRLEGTGLPEERPIFLKEAEEG
jgi:hypothetical protein